PWFTLDTVIGTSLAVLGIGMVFSAFTGGGRPLLGLAVPLSIAGLLVTTLPLAEMPGGGFGELNARPQSAAEVRDVYQRTGGTITLDLTDLPADSEPVKTKVAVGMGEANVILPETADVTLTCENSMGQIDCLGRQVHGLGVDDVTVTEEGVGEGPQITLDVSSMAGTVEETKDAVALGDANVILPEAADGTRTCENSMGEIDCHGRQVHDLGVDDVTVTEEGVGEGPQITLDVSSMAGTVEVTRVR